MLVTLILVFPIVRVLPILFFVMFRSGGKMDENKEKIYRLYFDTTIMANINFDV